MDSNARLVTFELEELLLVHREESEWVRILCVFFMGLFVLILTSFSVNSSLLNFSREMSGHGILDLELIVHSRKSSPPLIHV